MSVKIDQFLTQNLSHQNQVASAEEWELMENLASELSSDWVSAFFSHYVGDHKHKAALADYLRAKMSFILQGLSQDVQHLENQCATRKVLAEKEAKVIEQINSVVSSILDEDADKSPKGSLFAHIVRPELADKGLQRRLEREMNYQPPGLLEDLKTVGRCFGRGQKETQKIQLEEPLYEDYIQPDTDIEFTAEEAIVDSSNVWDV